VPEERTGDTLTGAITALLRDAQRQATTPRARDALRDGERRMSEPLRLAIAGRVKAGKSTLLNALLAEDLAPTDAGECTRIVTWYRRGDSPRVVLHPRSGPPRERPFDRSSGPVEVDLGTHTPDDVDHLDVHWPTQRLQALTLIDTPGLASIAQDVSAATTRALTDEDDRPAVADAVLYLLRHTHASDVRFLEAFHDDELAHGTPMNAVGVLSRADEVGSARLDALELADRVAARYQQEPRLQRLCPVVVPVAGLLAYGGVTLREQEYRALVTLADAPAAESAPLLLTADRFVRRPSSLRITQMEREHLLARLGLFGVRLSVELIRTGVTPSADRLADELVARSGLTRLRSVVLAQFTERSRILKARSALAVLASVVAGGEVREPDRLRARAEEIVSGAHAFVEVRMLNELRWGTITVPAARAAELERLLGGSGHSSWSRLGLPAQATPEELEAAAMDALARWRRVGEHPLSSRGLQRAAGVAVRSVEGVLAGLDPVRGGTTS
jgi:hypothetical protein